MNAQSKRAFTLIELLIVITIIGMLSVVTASSYTSVTRSSRDARRKTDLEQLRSALEQYRSNNGTYVTAPALSVACNVTGGISDANGSYLSAIPTDPRCNANTYYSAVSANDYTLGAFLENANPSTPCAGNPSCGAGVVCNYCLGPYGRK